MDPTRLELVASAMRKRKCLLLEVRCWVWMVGETPRRYRKYGECCS